LHESVTKEKSDEISLIEAKNEANNELLASFSTKSSGISAIVTQYPSRAKVSISLYLKVHSLSYATNEISGLGGKDTLENISYGFIKPSIQFQIHPHSSP